MAPDAGLERRQVVVRPDAVEGRRLKGASHFWKKGLWVWGGRDGAAMGRRQETWKRLHQKSFEKQGMLFLIIYLKINAHTCAVNINE